jgi:DNA polymerase-3 subunit epsilon
MFKHLVLHKPLAIIDLETTGTDPQTDRIVEISILKVLPDRRQKIRTYRVNPGTTIPSEASAVHGITYADVANEPSFNQLAADLFEFLDGCDLCGFNFKRFDMRLLYLEFKLAGQPLSLEGRAILDPMEIFHARERRDLSAPVRFYLRREHDHAHSASADALATAEVLDEMLGLYDDLPRTAAGLHQYFKNPNSADSSGKFVRIEGELRFAFGKYSGQPLEAVARMKPDYLQWMLTQDFFDDTKALVKDALCRSRARIRPRPELCGLISR